MSAGVLLVSASVLAAQGSDTVEARSGAAGVRRTPPVHGRATTDLLVGRFPGVLVYPASGLTGSGNRVRIRGQGSLYLGNRPVVYVDGVRIEGMAHDRTIFDRGPSPLDDINPDDVDSIVVVHGPSAGGMYGPEAATGVILVYLARGGRAPVRWRAYVEEGRLWDGTEWPANYGGVDADNAIAQYRDGGCTLDAEARGLCSQDFIRSASPLEAQTQFRTAPRRRAGLSVNGGVGPLTYWAGVAAEREAGLYRLSESEAARLTASGFPLRDHVREPSTLRRLQARLRLGVALASGTELDLWGILGSHVLRPGPDLDLLASGLRGSSTAVVNGGWRTPPGTLFQTERDQDVGRRTAGVRVTHQVSPWLRLAALAGWDRYAADELALTRTGEGIQPSPFRRSGALTVGRAEVAHRTLVLEAAGRHRLFGLEAVSIVRVRHTKRTHHDWRRSEVWSVGDTAADSLFAVEQTVRRGESPILGFFVEQRFAWGSRLVVTGGVRADRRDVVRFVSRPDDDWVFHPNARLEWLVTQPARGALDQLTFHAGFGTADQRVPDPWMDVERTAEGEVGAGATFWEGRAAVRATLYARRLTQGLQAVGGGPLVNVARVQNRGVEIEVASHLVLRQGFSWEVWLGAWGNRNRVERGPGGVIEPWQLMVPGYPLGSYWGNKFRYRDANGDGLIARAEVTADSVSEYLGNPFPSHGASLWSSVTLAGRMRLSGLLEYRAGHQLLNRTAWGRCISGVCQELYDRSTSLARQAAAIAGTGVVPVGTTPAGFIEDADFVKLRVIAVTYPLPVSVVSRVGARAASLTLAGRNLATWTGYSGADPEAIGFLRPEETGLEGLAPLTPAGLMTEDYMVQPAPRIWMLRLDVTF
ncbi:MAG TPA: TonB-dependent receptor [Gemmatimonadales bacterium]|nr:TonB-dependent receptor [Gemmatimonadales bacterium]